MGTELGKNTAACFTFLKMEFWRKTGGLHLHHQYHDVIMKGKIRAALKQEWVHCTCYKPPRIGASPPWGEINFLPLMGLGQVAPSSLNAIRATEYSKNNIIQN